jgi:signal transduction histidine kinase
LMLLLTTLFFASYVVADNNHWLPEPIVRSAFSMFITYMGVTANARIIALVIAENFKQLVSNGKKLTADLERRFSELKQSDDALRDLNNRLEQRVVERTAQYDETNKSLQNMIAKLELAQKELVQSEKLASLGSMVAGISHELNTPVGNAQMLTSSLENLFQQIMATVSSGQVKRSELDELLKSGIEMAALATKSTRRAVDLMNSFKQVAVDQTSEQRRQFNLRNVVEDNLATLLPNIKKQRKTIRFINHVGSHIECDSYPGPLGQIITNLTQNAILHGFDGRDSGTVTIASEELPDMILLTVTDDGVGMEPAVLVHVFDPFFTTKLGKGGSGIGLSISYRIATSILGGNLTASSVPGKGACFTLTIPNIAPYKF